MRERKKMDKEKGWNPRIKRNKFYGIKKEPSTFVERKINENDFINKKDAWLILLMLVERAWSYSKKLINEYDDDHTRKRHHSIRKLGRAVKYCNHFYKIVSNKCNVLTKLQMYLYLADLKSEYYLQREQDKELEIAYKEFIKVREMTNYLLTLNNDKIKQYLYIQNNTTALTNKIAFLSNKIDKKKLNTITNEVENEVTSFINAMKKEANENNEILEQKKDENEGKMNELNRKDAYLIEFENEKGEILNKQMINLLKKYNVSLNELQNMNKKRKLIAYLSTLKMNEELLNLVQSELRKISELSDEAKPLHLFQRYLQFNKNRINIVRNCYWLQNKVFLLKNSLKQTNKKEVKNKSNNQLNKNAKLIYEFAVLSEKQIMFLDQLSNTVDIQQNNQLGEEIKYLRDAFDIQRNYYIGKIYYTNKEYKNSYTIFSDYVIPSANDYIKQFKYKKPEIDKIEKTSLAKLIDIEIYKKIINGIIFDSTKLQLLSKGYDILCGEISDWKTSGIGGDDEDDKKIVDDKPLLDKLNDENILNEDYLIDLEMNIYPLLPKPVLFDLAWNYVHYQRFDDAAKKVETEEKPKEVEKKEEPKPQKQRSWLGSLFG